VEKIVAKNSILQARIKGLKNAVIIKNIYIINKGKATFWLPTKLKTTKQAIRDEEATK